VIAVVSLALLLQVTVSGPPGLSPARDAMPKGTASVKGRVVAADSGRPIRRVQINLSSPDFSEAKSMSTMADGGFEFKELPPGRYTITASRPGYIRLQYGQRRTGEPGRPVQLADGQKLDNLDFSLPRTGWVTGRITDELGDPMPGVSIYPTQWRYFRGKRRMVSVPSGSAAFNQTDETGQFRITGLEPGDYYVMGFTRTTWTVDNKPTERIGYLPTYSGGTANPTDALKVKVNMGQESAMGDFAMVPGRVANVSGTATYSSGAPLAGETINVTQEFASPNGSSSFGMQGAKVNPDGSFTIKNMAPGEYRLSVRGPGDKDHPAEGVTTTVTVMGEDVTGLLLAAGSGGTLSGRIVSDTGGAIPIPEQSRMRVSARPVDPTTTYSSFDNDNGRVKDDQSFELTNVYGQNRLSVSPLPTGWAVRSIDVGGKDYADAPIDLRGGIRLDGVTITLSKSLPKLQGTLRDPSGQPIEGSVLIFPEEASKWAEDSRLVRSARPDASGTFEIRNLIPGSYLVTALEYVRDGEWADPEFLEKLREGAKRVQVDEKGAAAVALTLSASSRK
jgi:protocatechuate 3,4-dioxygenase beta subunit